MYENITLVCSSCGEQCSVIKVQEEYYPGHYTALFTSSCCDAQITDENGKDYKQVFLNNYYTYIESFHVDPDLT